MSAMCRVSPVLIRKRRLSTSCHRNLREVIEMLLEDGEPELETKFVGTHIVVIP
jgi:hypothetical protein